jgi:hypothetical protein
VCLAENPVDEECIAASFLFCAECVADPGCDEGFVCIDNVCVQPLPPILDAGSGTTTTSYECFIEGTVSLTLAVDVNLFLLSDGSGTVDIEYDVRAREVGSFLLGGVAAETNIIIVGSVPVPPFEGPCDQPPLPTTPGCEAVGPTEVVTTVANGTAAGPLGPGAIQTSLDLGVPPLNLNNFLIPQPPVFPPFVEIVLASMIDPPLANICDGTTGAPPATNCEPGNVPIGWQPTSEFVQPDAAGTDVDFQVGGINLIISAVGGGLILPVSTTDPTICDPNDTVVGAPISIAALAQ